MSVQLLYSLAWHSEQQYGEWPSQTMVLWPKQYVFMSIFRHSMLKSGTIFHDSACVGLEQGLEEDFLVAVELGATSLDQLSEAQLDYVDKIKAKLLQVCKCTAVCL